MAWLLSRSVWILIDGDVAKDGRPEDRASVVLAAGGFTNMIMKLGALASEGLLFQAKGVLRKHKKVSIFVLAMLRIRLDSEYLGLTVCY